MVTAQPMWKDLFDFMGGDYSVRRIYPSLLRGMFMELK
jgi:hypothetical protein